MAYSKFQNNGKITKILSNISYFCTPSRGIYNVLFILIFIKI